MRWLVEVAAIDNAETHQSIVVEAESWQKALQAGRAARGEPGPISGFSIELLDEGYRAIDPTARKRYVVKRAPADAVAEVIAAPSAPPPGQSAAPPPEPIPAAPPAPHVPPAPGSAPRPSSGPPRPPPPTKRPTGGTLIAGSAHAVAAGAAPTPPPPPRMDPDATIRTDSFADSSVEILSITDAPSAPPAPPPPQDLEPVIATQVIFKREHDPSERVPLTYREYVYAVARGADEAAAERLLHHQLENVKRAISRAKKGKFVNLAVFDVVFQGRPPVPPLATLAWKDWVGTPAIGFPRRPHAPPVHAHVHAPQPPSAPPPPPPRVETTGSEPPAGGYAAALEPVAAVAVTPAPPPPASFPAPASVHTPFAAPHEVAAAPAPMAIPVSQLPTAPPAPPPVAIAPAPVHFPVATSGIDPFAPGTVALPVGVPVPPAGPGPVIANAPAGYVPPPRGIMNTPTPSRPSLRQLASRRASGDELIATLFEAMHELHFARDVIEGGDYVLSLVMEMIPSRAALIHLYDIDRREYVVACAVGAGTDSLLNRRHAENESLLSAAMRKRRAIVVGDASNSEYATSDRFLALGGVKTFISSPVILSGRFLGVIEVLNPLDGVAFTDKEGNALDYISDQFGEFVSTRGMLLDPERIAKRVVLQ